MILYVEGDSYSTPGFCVREDLSYWSLFGRHVNADKIVNYAYPGKSMSGMIRCTTRFAIENKDQDIFFLLGFGPLERFDVGFQFGSIKNPNPAEPGVSSCRYSDSRQHIIGYNSELQSANFYSNLILLGSLLDSLDFKYMFHFMPIPLKKTQSPMLTSLRNAVEKNPSIVNLFEDTYYMHGIKNNIKPVDFDQTIGDGWQGHHGWQVNELYADYLIRHLL